MKEIKIITRTSHTQFNVAPSVPPQTLKTNIQLLPEPTSTSIHQQSPFASQLVADALQPHTSDRKQLFQHKILSPQSLPLSHHQPALQPTFQNVSSSPPEQNEEWKLHNPNKRNQTVQTTDVKQKIKQ